MSTKQDILAALQEACEGLETAPDDGPANSMLGGFRLSEFEAHARGTRPFSEEQLSEIRRDPVRRKLLAAFERECAPQGHVAARHGPNTARVREWLQSWLNAGAVLRPLPVGAMMTEGFPIPAYPLLVEDGGLFIEESSIDIVFPPMITPGGELVFKAAFNPRIAQLVTRPSIRTELSVFSGSPERVLGLVEIAGARPYVRLPLPPGLLELPQWRDLRRGGALPFALVLHVREVQLKAATL
jgi:hypothetical protein